MVSLFLWMFRLPPVLPHQVVKVRRTVSALQRIIVPVVETVPAERAVEIAARLGQEQRAEIILVYVIEVPLTLPLSASMPVQETAAKDTLRTAEVLVRQHNLPVRTEMVPARHAADGILHVSRDEDADVIIMGVGVKRRSIPEQLGRTATEVLRRARCEVVLDKAPIEAGAN
jgi:nucleotide-binding universal stress UspA family protein